RSTATADGRQKDPAKDKFTQGSQSQAERPPQPPLPKGGRRESDWQTLHYALMALEAITGENLELAGDIDRAPAAWQVWWRETGSVENLLKRLTARPETSASGFARDAWLEAVGRTRWLSRESSRGIAAVERPAWQKRVRGWLQAEELPPVAAVRAAGLLRDAEAVPLLAPLLIRGGFAKVEETCPDCEDSLRREAEGTAIAKEAALALGRIGNEEAVGTLWELVAKTVPNAAPIAVRHYQTGPRPEEYTYLRALIYANAIPRLEHVPYLIALLPYTEGEKPRFEDRTKIESQRVWLGRILLERAGVREAVVKLAADVLRGVADNGDPLYQQVLVGTNIDRPRSEHGRNFPVVKQLEPEQALHLLSCLAERREEIPEALVAPRLRSDNHRERIEAAVIFRKFGYSPQTERILRDEAGKAYTFGEIWSIGKGRPDTQFRDKAYFLMALAAHARDVAELESFIDYQKNYRDVRLGLAIGLGFRGTSDGYPLLERLARDPIFSVHRECANAAVEIYGAQSAVGRDVARLHLPPREPLKPEYGAPGSYVFADRTPALLALAGTVTIDPDDAQALVKALKSAVDAAQYKNVGNGHARNAERMRIFDAVELAKILDAPAATAPPLTPELEQALTAALESPYPFAHYLAARLIAVRQEQKLAPLLAQKLLAFVAAADTVGVYWTADTLGRLQAPEGIEPLSKIAIDKSFDRTFGSIGMAYGFAAARGLGMIAGDPRQPDAAKLLKSENPWLRAGVLDGLVERGDTALAGQLEAILADSPSAILEQEALHGLRMLKVRDGRRADRGR
ncbi:MAG TPA: HEAT repeat domain-containing protein, partial [Planctomycetaceae bacterium]|nr:HEAT repeat domain-containing protein [Planctomycetaceae bacterium]